MQTKMSPIAQGTPGFPGPACFRGGTRVKRAGSYLLTGLLKPCLRTLRLKRELRTLLSKRDRQVEESLAHYNRTERLQLAEIMDSFLDRDLADLRNYKRQLMEAVDANPEGGYNPRVEQLLTAIEALGRTCSRIAMITKVSFSLFSSNKKDKEEKFYEAFKNLTGMTVFEFQDQMKTGKE